MKSQRNVIFLFTSLTCLYLIDKNQGEKVSLTTRTLEWYRLEDATARALILLITISENPLKLKAGNFIDISLRTFGNVSNTAILSNLLNNKVKIIKIIFLRKGRTYFNINIHLF